MIEGEIEIIVFMHGLLLLSLCEEIGSRDVRIEWGRGEISQNLSNPGAGS